MGTAGAKDDRRLLAEWASDCVERVLPLFESRHPADPRPRQAVETTRAWVRGEVTVGQAREAAFATHAAAREASDPAARAAARAAGQAVASAHMAGHARHATSYAVAAVRHALPSGQTPEEERAWQKGATASASSSKTSCRA